jgi:hypothetical protein
MDASGRWVERERYGRQGDVDPLGLQPVLEHGVGEALLLGGDRLGNAVAQQVDGGPAGLALLGRQGADRFQKLGDGALLAEGGNTDGLQRGIVARGGDALQKIALKRGDIGHRSVLDM